MKETRAMEISPYCRHLKSKKTTFLNSPPQSDEDILDGSNHCWCGKTQMSVGPDLDLVLPAECRKSRECFVRYGDNS